MSGLIPIILLFAVMYLLVIRPQQRRVREHASFVQSLRYGEEVVTAGGVFGTISALQEETVMLEVSPGVSVKVMRSSVTRRVGDDPVEEIDELEELVELEQSDDVTQVDGSAERADGDTAPGLPSTDDPRPDRP